MFGEKIGNLDQKIPNINVLVTTNVFNTNTGKVNKKIPDISGLLTTAALKNLISKSQLLVFSWKKADYDAKISKIEGKYFITSYYNKFMSDILDLYLI